MSQPGCYAQTGLLREEIRKTARVGARLRRSLADWVLACAAFGWVLYRAASVPSQALPPARWAPGISTAGLPLGPTWQQFVAQVQYPATVFLAAGLLCAAAAAVAYSTWKRKRLRESLAGLPPSRALEVLQPLRREPGATGQLAAALLHALALPTELTPARSSAVCTALIPARASAFSGVRRGTAGRENAD